jgi:pectate lyase
MLRFSHTCAASFARLLCLALIACGLLSAAAAQPLAFPGAEGFGRNASGGRGGAVIYVTNLNDSGAGSLRAAVSASGPRTVVFAVSGTIYLQSTLRIRNGNLTIAGQTAPGDGITVANYPIDPSNASNVIIRFIRSRLGDNMSLENDAFNIRYADNVIIDHCSFSWGIDETATAYDNTNFTMQWCIIAESLRDSVHEKGLHGYGGIWGGRGATFHHNLLAHHDSRNPRLNGARYHGQDDELVDFRNNVIYNWGGNSVYGGEPASETIKSRHNLVNNYYKFGPATASGVRSRILQPTALETFFGLFYVDGNYVQGSATITANNWSGGVQGVNSSQIAQLRSLTPFQVPAVIEQPAVEAYQHVLQFAGASRPNRDSVDARIVNEVATGTYTYVGSRGGRLGLIDSQNDVGGWPVLISLPAPLDSDLDGMPDAWELAHGLNPFSAADRNFITDDSGYTNLEKYLNSLVTDAFPRPVLSAQPSDLAVDPGSSFTLATTATGAAPFSYQWFKDGQAISGANSPSYTAQSAAAADAGSYHVVVSNGYGSTPSASAAVVLTTVVTTAWLTTDFSSDTLHAAEPALSPTATNWYVMASKLATASSFITVSGQRQFSVALNAATTSGIAETVAKFAHAPVKLEREGDALTVTARFSVVNVSTLGIGLYRSDGKLPHTGLINGTLTNTSDTYAFDGTRDWVGYRASLVSGSSTGASIATRPVQTATNNRAQALVIPGTSSSYEFPVTVGTVNAAPNTLSLTDNTDYTLRYRIERAGADELGIELEIYAGGTISGSPVYRSSANSTASGALPSQVSDSFDAVALGFRTIANTVAPRLVLRSLSVVQRSARVPSPFAQFMAAFGLDPEAEGVLWADADGDGIPNAFEFALGGDPASPDSSILPRPTPAPGGGWEFRFLRSVAALEQFTLVPESSLDLATWQPIVNGVDGATIAVSPAVDGFEEVIVTLPEETRRFARLRISEK